VNALTAFKIALRALRTHGLRSALTMLGIMVGVAAVLAMFAIGDGARLEVERHIEALGADLMTIVPGSVTAGGIRLGAGARVSLTEDDARALQREVADVLATAPTLRGSVHVVAGRRNWLTSLHGSTPEFFEVRNWPVAWGRSYENTEVQTAAKVVVLGATVAQELFGGADPVGQVVRVRNVPMEIVGVLAPKGRTIQGDDYDDMVVMPISTARKRVLGGIQAKVQSIHYISMKIHDDADMALVKDDVRALLRERHRLRPDQVDDFKVHRSADVLFAREETTREMTLLLAAIASVALVVAGIGIVNVMLVAVRERTREIGLRLAVGARARDIRFQFLMEALTLTLVSAACGVLLGFGASYAIGYLAGWRTAIDAEAVVSTVGFAVLLGILFGFYPAHKASTLTPVEALRDD
jgi:putative ABC transport system permease protein